MTARADTAIVRSIRKLLRERRAGGTICPSEVARALSSDDWRSRMDDVRRIAAKLVSGGEVIVTQRGREVDVATARGPVRIARADAKRSYVDAYRDIDFREHPEKYRIGRGEEGVLVAEPYKSELLPLWRFRTPEIAKVSAVALAKKFREYRAARDFVGMDMARKYLQMGFTRARRYANRRSGRKYEARDVARSRSARAKLPTEPDAEKAESARIFYEAWQRVERDRAYVKMRAAWRESEKASRGRATARS